VLSRQFTNTISIFVYIEKRCIFSSSKECQNQCRTLILWFSRCTPVNEKNIRWFSTKFVLSHQYFFWSDGVICLARRIVHRKVPMEHCRFEIKTTFLGFDRLKISYRLFFHLNFQGCTQTYFGVNFHGYYH
jgi:hypothetical protein